MKKFCGSKKKWRKDQYKKREDKRRALASNLDRLEKDVGLNTFNALVKMGLEEQH